MANPAFYIFRVTASLVHKNNRDQGVYNELKRLHMHLIDADYLSAFKEELKSIVAFSPYAGDNGCKPMPISFIRYDNNDLVVHFGQGQITCRIEKITGIYKY